jgi:hypothetical protein
MASFLLVTGLTGCGGDDPELPVATARTDLPKVTYALPGEWMRADLTDARQVDKAKDELDARTDDASSWLTEAIERGGTLLDFRLRAEPSTVLLFAWPPDEARGDPSLEGLRRRVEGNAEEIEHAAGYAAVRVRSKAEEGGEVLTYYVVHPDSGRMLMVGATAFGAPFDQIDLETFDLVASRLWWEEPAA